MKIIIVLRFFACLGLSRPAQTGSRATEADAKDEAAGADAPQWSARAGEALRGDGVIRIKWDVGVMPPSFPVALSRPPPSPCLCLSVLVSLALHCIVQGRVASLRVHIIAWKNQPLITLQLHPHVHKGRQMATPFVGM